VNLKGFPLAELSKPKTRGRYLTFYRPGENSRKFNEITDFHQIFTKIPGIPIESFIFLQIFPGESN
jgi:hypothetical protein